MSLLTLKIFHIIVLVFLRVFSGVTIVFEQVNENWKLLNLNIPILDET